MQVSKRDSPFVRHGNKQWDLDLDEYLTEAGQSFVKDSVYMQSRDQFEEYMRVMENRFYETVKLPKSPYVDA